MRITSKGQVTIPQAVRESAGLLPNTEVDIVLEDGKRDDPEGATDTSVCRAGQRAVHVPPEGAPAG